MKSLVTGATGFVGGHLVETLRHQGVEVVALVRSPDRATRLKSLGVTLAPGDLDDAGAMRQALAGVGTVYHVAGLTAARNAGEFQRVNVDGTARLVEEAVRAGAARLVFVSSLAAAGPSFPGTRHPAEDSSAPVTRYGQSKAAAEEVVRQGKIPFVIARPPAVYGPRDRELLKVFRMARRGWAPVFGDGAQELSLVYGPDLAAALAAMGRAPGVEGGTFYPAHPEVVTSEGLVRAIGTAVGRRVRVFRVPRPVGRALLHLTGAAARLAGRATLLTADKANEFFQPAWTCDPAPLALATGWRATHDTAAGLALTAEWYRGAGWL